MGTFIKIYQEDPYLIKIRQKYQVLGIRARYVLLLPTTFICHKITAQQYQMYCIIAFAQRYKYFIVDIDTCRLTIQREHIVEFPWP